ncbi:MAG: hypothetical protein R3F59_18010 [Myxococcota bacterium]
MDFLENDIVDRVRGVAPGSELAAGLAASLVVAGCTCHDPPSVDLRLDDTAHIDTAASETESPVDSAPPEPLTWVRVDAAYVHSCGILSDQRLVCWGEPSCLPQTAPDARYRWVDASGFASCAIGADGSLDCWCCHDEAVCDRPVPDGPFVQVRLADGWGCAQRADGTLACFGHPRWQHTGRMPTEPVQDFAVDANYACAVLGDGSLQCWGDTVLWQEDGYAPRVSRGCARARRYATPSPVRRGVPGRPAMGAPTSRTPSPCAHPGAATGGECRQGAWRRAGGRSARIAA